MSVLVCGGAGYIGSHTVHQLIKNGEDVIIVDNLQTGHMDAVHKDAKFCKGDIRDKDFLRSVFKKYRKLMFHVKHWYGNQMGKVL